MTTSLSTFEKYVPLNLNILTAEEARKMTQQVDKNLVNQKDYDNIMSEIQKKINRAIQRAEYEAKIDVQLWDGKLDESVSERIFGELKTKGYTFERDERFISPITYTLSWK